MSNIQIIKTDKGFILRQSTWHLIEYLLLSLLGLGLGVFFMIRALSAEGEAVALNGICGLIGFCLGLFILLTQVGHRLVLDEEGVHLYHLGMRGKFMPWWQVRDWGTTRKSIKVKYGYETHYFLYFSFMKGTTSGPDCLQMRVSKSDSQTLPKSAIRRYIRARMHKEEEE